MVNDRNNQISPIKTVIAVLLPLFELGLGSFFIERVPGQVLKATVSSGFSLIAFLIAIYLFKDLLVSEWHGYRKHIWRNLGLSLIGTILCFVILSGVSNAHVVDEFGSSGNGVDVLSIQLSKPRQLGYTQLFRYCWHHGLKSLSSATPSSINSSQKGNSSSGLCLSSRRSYLVWFTGSTLTGTLFRQFLIWLSEPGLA